MSEPFDHRAAAGVADPELALLFEEHWESLMRRYPVWASQTGDRRYDHLLPGTRPADREASRAEDATFLARARAMDPAALSPEDRLTLRVFLEDLEPALAVDAFHPEEWQLLPRGTPVSFLGFLPELRPVEAPAEAEALLARYRGFPAVVAGELETLALGVAAGKFANAESVRRIVTMVRAEIVRPTEEWAAVSRAGVASDGAREIVDSSIRPAFQRYADYLETEILPHARTGGQVGMSALPDGDAAYAALIRQHTSLPLEAREIHETGIAELKKIHAEFADLGERVFGTRTIRQIFSRLRSDPDLYFTTAEEVEAGAVRALDAARRAMPDWFGRLPKAECVVKRIPEHEAPYTTIAYYRPASGDGERPGEYRINVLDPETRPRHEAEALAFHEAIPGHHLQIAIAQELPEMPAFRRHGGFTAYLEGWALYTERLADEMGLYGGDTDRLGMLSFDAWRAARLVVDTGVHAFGWDRDRAVAFMIENTPLAENNVDNEVDRYISWPGQALAYKIGQIEMWSLRREAEAALGDRFDLKDFHDLVLGGGALPLAVLRERVEEWMAGA